MQNIETLSKVVIRKYIDILTKDYGLKDPVHEKAILILFNTNLYGECIREIKEIMKLPCAFNVLTYEDHVFPNKEAAALIKIPIGMPLYGTKSFEDLKLNLELRKSLRKDYHNFVTCIAHELSHVVLYSTGHSLKSSEIATDLFAMICGFSEIMSKSRNVGYLDDKHFKYAYSYLQLVRKSKNNNNLTVKFKMFLEKFKI